MNKLGNGIIFPGLFSLLMATSLSSQTLFVRADTTPDYSSYEHLEECRVAVLRLTDEVARKDIVWYDTASTELRHSHRLKVATTPRPDTAIAVANMCLRSFNMDTVTYTTRRHVFGIAGLLLMAHRDSDATELYTRLKDSARARSNTEIKDVLRGIIESYRFAIPLRLVETKRHYNEILKEYSDDSLYYTVDISIQMYNAAIRAGDSAYAEKVAWHAIQTHDAIPAKERMKQPMADTRLPVLQGLIRRLTQEEALDSLSKSTLAYRKYEAYTVRQRILGDSIPVENVEVGATFPNLTGENYYVATNNKSGNSGLGFKKIGAVPDGQLPVSGRVNLLVYLPSICHAEGTPRTGDAPTRSACMSEYAHLRRIKNRFPEVELTVFTNTYGTVGALPLLKPDDEADTLAKLFLGHHNLPAHLVVETTPFFKVAEPDGRRIDLLTPNIESVLRIDPKFTKVYLTDKNGVWLGGAYTGNFAEKFIEILLKRDGN